VALSGGVDSAVAALELVRRGCDVIAVTTKNFCFDRTPFDASLASGSCCSAEATDAARQISAELGIVHTVLDVADDFESQVVRDYVEQFHRGRTPSPCVLCNEKIRFPHLMALADKLDAPWLATGHYARIVRHAHAGRFIARGVDSGKDQSYFLYRMGEEALARVTFPLGELDKGEVRARARRDGLPVASTPDSQELCFVPDGDRSRVLGEGAGPGDLVDGTGRVLGRHPGVEYFTVGQRKGLGIGGPRAWYVTRLDAENNRVVLGDRDDLLRTRLVCTGAILRDPEAHDGAPPLMVKTRYRHRGCRVDAVRLEGDRLLVELAEADVGPAPGQAAVLYRNDVVVGGGCLEATH
jgi:tRNA-specific 2-thiouridylase